MLLSFDKIRKISEEMGKIRDRFNTKIENIKPIQILAAKLTKPNLITVHLVKRSKRKPRIRQIK